MSSSANRREASGVVSIHVLGRLSSSSSCIRAGDEGMSCAVLFRRRSDGPAASSAMLGHAGAWRPKDAKLFDPCIEFGEALV